MTSPESHELQDMANPEPFRASSPTMSTSPARSVSPAGPTRVLTPSPTISDLDLDEEREVSNINPLVESTSNPQEATAESTSEPHEAAKTSNLESPRSPPKSASEPDSNPGSDESPPKSTSEPDLTPTTSSGESRKSSKLSMPGSYMSSNVDMSELEDSHQSPADSAEASEQSPSPPKTPPSPPPKGSYAAVDKDVLYTCFINGQNERELQSRFVLLRMRVMDAFGWVTGAVLTNKIIFTYYLPRKAKNPLSMHENPSPSLMWARVQREARPLSNVVESRWDNEEGGALLKNESIIFPNGDTRFRDGSIHDAFGKEIKSATVDEEQNDRAMSSNSEFSETLFEAWEKIMNENTNTQEDRENKEEEEMEKIFPLEDLDKM